MVAITCPDSVPTEGYPLRVLLPGIDRTLWWGRDSEGEDVVAASGGQVFTWSDPQVCLAAVSTNGWTAADPDSDVVVMDLRPVTEWIRRRRLCLDPVAALNAWNLAYDVASSIGTTWSDRNRLAEVCYDKLLTANAPWLIDKPLYIPRWTKIEERQLRQRLTAATTLLTRAFAPRTH